MQHDVRSALGFDGVLHRVLGVALATPMHGFRVLLVGLGEDFHLLRYHESAVEAQTEVPDDGFRLVFVFVHELLGAGESDLVDVFVHLLGGHADTVVLHGQRLLVLI